MPIVTRTEETQRHSVTHVTGDCSGRRIVEIADRVRRLVPSRHDPEKFHVEKSEIEHDLRQLARVLPSAQAAVPWQPEKSPALGDFGPKLRGRKG